MENKSNLTDDMAKEMMEKVFQDPEVRAQLTGMMISAFSGWALDNRKQEEIHRLLAEFKKIIAACINAKPDIDERIVLLAMAIMTEDFAVAQAMVKANIVLEDVKPPSLWERHKEKLEKNMQQVTEPPVEAKEWKQ